MKQWIFGAALLVGAVAGAGAQVPAGAPAGTNGICKDGTYSTAAKKEGACRGHKGIQTWYVAATAAPASAPAATPASKPPTAMPAPTPAASTPSRPAATPTNAPAAAMPAPTPAAAGKRLSPTQAAAQKTAAPGGGAGLVWVNTDSNVYHCNGDVFYGKTKVGAYMSEADAKAKGAHGERGKSCAGK